MSRTVFIFINGINTLPTDQRGWTDRARNWIVRETDFGADKFEWFGGPLTAQLFAPLREQQLLRVLGQYPLDTRLILVGHSFGCELICRVLAHVKCPNVQDAWLIAAACTADFRTNGLNRAMGRGQLGRVFCLQASRDGALALAKQSALALRWSRWLKLIPGVHLDYGWLGLTGPTHVAYPPRVEVTQKPDHIGHSSYVNTINLAATLSHIVNEYPPEETA
jgi:hypothetical protein